MSSSSPPPLPFAGTVPCQATVQTLSATRAASNDHACHEKARYYVSATNKVYCGVHNKKNYPPLPSMSEDQRAAHTIALQIKLAISRKAEAQRNQRAGERGKVVLFQMHMMHNVDPVQGWLDVFPNYRDYTKPFGFACPELSPRCNRVCVHGQPGLPDAKSIEVFHQGSKRFPWENTDDEFSIHQRAFFESSIPHRHKTPETVHQALDEQKEARTAFSPPSFSPPHLVKHKRKRSSVASRKSKDEKIRWLYFVWIDESGRVWRLDTPTSRQFYCNFYEQHLLASTSFQTLRACHANGENLRICGYDAKPLRSPLDFDTDYLDPTFSWGHERVIYTMLLEHDPTKWPWRKYRTFVLAGRPEPPPCSLRVVSSSPSIVHGLQLPGADSTTSL